MNSICEVELDALVLSEPVVKMSYGIEQLKEILVRYKRLSGKTDNFLVYFSVLLQYAVVKYCQPKKGVRHGIPSRMEA